MSTEVTPIRTCIGQFLERIMAAFHKIRHNIKGIAVDAVQFLAAVFCGSVVYQGLTCILTPLLALCVVGVVVHLFIDVTTIVVTLWAMNAGHKLVRAFKSSNGSLPVSA